MPNTKTFTTYSEKETEAKATLLANELFHSTPQAFIELSGPLGAGKTAFARGFIREWLKLAGEPIPETLVSPTYNLAKVYGKSKPLAHLDLYRLESLEELEQLGYEHYFYEQACCLVEWLEKIPEAKAIRPKNAIRIVISQKGDEPNLRVLRIENP